MVKLFSTNKETDSMALTIPKRIRAALGWEQGDKIEVTLGRDRTIILKKQE